MCQPNQETDKPLLLFKANMMFIRVPWATGAIGTAIISAGKVTAHVTISNDVRQEVPDQRPEVD